jgi:hypothetical protein
LAASLNAWSGFMTFRFLSMWQEGRRLTWNLLAMVVFGGHRENGPRMDKLQFDETDYSVVVKNRADPPNPWRWEIYRAGRSSAIGQSPNFFQTMPAASKPGKTAVKQLMGKLNA